ncbi:phosphatidate cytidylyltransferase [uncultured Helicobacter sp.]|uniref:phosphatidate cytidylyltransferase n=1 Tax=uncultured Helicobacter sp. TaxID=175537 RepID=UPI00262303ED|nr:phosphatidate cytidylyltransferase [uncultured Helicobacter sp.]
MLKNLKLIEPIRLYTAMVMLIAIVLIVLFHHPLLLWAVLGVAFIIGFYESYKLYNQTTPRPLFLSFAILIWLSVYYLESPLGVFVILIFLGAYQSYTKKGKLEQMLPFIYPTIPFIFLYLLYLDDSINAIIWLIVIVGLTDSFAYFGGKLLGSKLFANSAFCPTSPNKTKEGVLVGVGIATLIGSLMGLGVCGFFTSLVLTFITSITSVFGDLYESYLKRQAGVKDSGSILPGHGGILDRLDGYFFAVIILYTLLRVVQ